MHGHMVHAVANFGIGIGDAFGLQAAVDRLPRLARVVSTKRAGGRDGDVDALGIARIEDDRMQTHAAGAGLPHWPRAVLAQPRQLLPRLAGVF